MITEAPVKLGLMVGGFAIRHIAAALLEFGYSRLQQFFDPEFLWVDDDNKEDLRYMKYLSNWEAIKAEQIEQILLLGWPKDKIIIEPFHQRRLIDRIGDLGIRELYGQMHGGIVGPTAIKMLKGKFHVTHPCFEIPTERRQKKDFRIPKISRGYGAPERLVSVIRENGRFFVRVNPTDFEGTSEYDVIPRLQMALFKGEPAIKGDSWSVDSGLVKGLSPSTALKAYKREDALNPDTMGIRIAELMEKASESSAIVMRDRLVPASMTIKQAKRRGMTYEQGVKFGLKPHLLIREGLRPSPQDEFALRKALATY